MRIDMRGGGATGVDCALPCIAAGGDGDCDAAPPPKPAAFIATEPRVNMFAGTCDAAAALTAAAAVCWGGGGLRCCCNPMIDCRADAACDMATTGVDDEGSEELSLAFAFVEAVGGVAVGAVDAAEGATGCDAAGGDGAAELLSETLLPNIDACAMTLGRGFADGALGGDDTDPAAAAEAAAAVAGGGGPRPTAGPSAGV